MAELQDVLRFVEKTQNKVRKFCDPLIHHFEINEFVYEVETKNGGTAAINFHHDWMHCYWSDKMYLLNPLSIHPDNHLEGFLSVESIDDESTKSLILHAKKNFGIHLSFLVCNKITNGMEFFVFGLKSPAPKQVMKFYNEIPLIKAFVKRFKEEFKSEILALENYQINVAKLKGPAYQNPSFNLFPEPVDRANFLEKLGLEIPQPLTPKELDVIKYLTKGLPAPKIAERLFISSRTVEHHLERIKDKFDCTTKAELIQKIQKLHSFGYLNLEDENLLVTH